LTQVVEAIFSHGVLKPLDPLTLPEDQRVRLVVEPISQPGKEDRAEAIAQLRAGIAQMNFHLTGPLPTRDELHERR